MLRNLFIVWMVLAGLHPVDSVGQYPSDSLRHWLSVLAREDNTANPVVDSLMLKMAAASEPDLLSFRQALQASKKANPYFDVRRQLLHARFGPKDSTGVYFKSAVNKAYELGDEELIAFASWRYGSHMAMWRAYELAVMYCLNAGEIYQKIGKPMSGMQYFDLGTVLYFIREYEKALPYLKLGAAGLRNDFFMATCVNTIGLTYQKLGQNDSALLYYDSAALFLHNPGNTEEYREIWKGILAGNKGQIYFLQGQYPKALPLFEYDVHQSITHGEFDNAANSLQWAARTNLYLGNTAVALQQIREAFYWINQRPEESYRSNVYRSAEEIYQAAGLKDSALYFGRKYMALHDSIEAKIADSRLEVSRMKLENEKNIYRIKSFQEQRKKEVMTRNLIIAGLLVLAAFLIVYLNSVRANALHRQQLAAEKNKQARLEIAAAKEQLDIFRQNLVEKTRLLDELTGKLHNNSINDEQLQVLSSLSQFTIITEEQWLSFRSLLEKVYPSFFHRLRETYPGITLAEQRMAALSKLRVSTKETAAMLGVSADTVRKTRQRLKQRIDLPNDSDLEEHFASW